MRFLSDEQIRHQFNGIMASLVLLTGVVLVVFFLLLPAAVMGTR